MKILFLLTLNLVLNSYANTKTLSFDDYVLSMYLKPDQSYQLVLQEHAAQYIAKNEHVGCLQEGMKLKKQVKLTVDPYSLNILSCVLPKK
ncbi:MAG: hypothetical protein L6Q33_09115 [Bacteriovoracaceae bacterium]|nr:hypothetical protein [Bacteriovoracaceae bacterium]